MNTRTLVALGALVAALLLPALASAQSRYPGGGRYYRGGYGHGRPPAVVVVPRPHPMHRPVVVVPPRGGRYEAPYGHGHYNRRDGYGYGYGRYRRGWGR